MLDLTKHNEVRESIRALLISMGAEKDVKFLVAIQEIDEQNERFRHAVVMSDTCGTCAGLMIDAATNAIIGGVTNGALTVHAMPEMFAGAAAFN